MSDATYREEGSIVFFPAVAGAAVTMTVATWADQATTTSLGCCDIMKGICDRGNISAVTLRIKDPAGYTTRVYSSGGSTAWSRVTVSGVNYSEKSVSVPVSAMTEEASGLVIFLDPSSGPALRRTQVVIIRHEPS